MVVPLPAESAFPAAFAAPWRWIDSADAVMTLFDPLRDAARETAAFAYLDPDWRLCGLRHTPAGGLDSVRLSVRNVVADAIAFGAAAVVMAHNHPSGDVRPSVADRDATRRIAQALGAIEVRLVDHLVLARRDWASFRTLGLL